MIAWSPASTEAHGCPWVCNHLACADFVYRIREERRERRGWTDARAKVTFMWPWSILYRDQPLATECLPPRILAEALKLKANRKSRRSTTAPARRKLLRTRGSGAPWGKQPKRPAGARQ